MIGDGTNLGEVMSHWNYRVVHRIFKNLDGNEEHLFCIHEAYYNDKNKVNSITKESVQLIENSVEELRSTLKLMLKALDEPILEYSKF